MLHFARASLPRAALVLGEERQLSGGRGHEGTPEAPVSGRRIKVENFAP